MVSSNQWSLDEIHANASNWSLEGDTQILGLMQTISKNLEERASKTKENINKMLLATDETNIRLRNTHNQLIALQHSQFVENRVYDEDETISNRDEVPDISLPNKNPPMTSAEAIKIAVKNCVQVLNTQYEKVTLDLDDDSDDESSDKKNILYHPKDPYKDCPLPYLIGSKEWCESWHIGLVDSDEELSNDEDNEVYSESSNEDIASLSASLPSNVIDSDNNPYESVLTQKPNTHLFENTIHDNVSTQNYSNNSNGNISMEKSEPTTVPSPIVIENVAQSRANQSTKNSDIFHKDINRNNQPTFVVNLFSDEPPELDDIPVEKNPVNLFLDSDDENSLSYSIPKRKNLKKEDVNTSSDTTNKSTKSESVSSTNVPKDYGGAKPKERNPPKKTVNLFDDDDFDSFMNVLDKTKPKEKFVKSNIANIFDDNPTDDLFDVIITSQTPRQPQKTNLFDDIDFNDDLPPVNEPIKKSENIISVKKDQTLKQPSHSSLFDDIDDFNDDYDTLFGKPQKENKSVDLKNNNVEKSDVEDVSVKEVEKPVLVNETKTNQTGLDWMDTLEFESDNKLFKISEIPPPLDDVEDDIANVSNEDPDFLISEQKSNVQKTVTSDLFTEINKSTPEPTIVTSKEKATIKPTRTVDLFSDIFNETKDEKSNLSFMDQEKNSVISNVTKDLFEHNPTAVSNKKPPLTTPFDYTSAINMFDDIPPPDDDDSNFFSSEINENNASNYFDDVSEVFDEKPRTNSTQVGYLFTDEPPPDDDTKSISSQNENLKDTPIDNQSLKSHSDETDTAANDSFHNKLSKFSQSTAVPDLDTQTEIVKPKKIVSNLNINVMALLPGARAPSTKQKLNVDDVLPTSEKTSDNDKEPEEDLLSKFFQSPKVSDVTLSTGTLSSQNSDISAISTSSDRLVGLGKNRAKAPGQRRQSSRKGRQEQYRKSLILQNDENSENSEIKKNFVESKLSAKKLIEDMPKSENRAKKNLIENVIVEPKLSNQIKENPLSAKKKLENELRSETKQVSLPKNEIKEIEEGVQQKKFVFYNDEDIASEQLNIVVANKNREAEVVKSDNKLHSSLFDDEVEEDLFKNVTLPKSTTSNKPNPKKDANELNKNPLFSEDEDEDDIFGSGTKIRNPSSEKISKGKVLPKSGNKKSLFSDDDDDDIFGSSQSKSHSNQMVKKQPTMESKTKLFDDSDDDNLFSNENKTQQKQRKIGKANVPELVKTAVVDDDPLADLLK